jgi:hypothetical protein
MTATDRISTTKRVPDDTTEAAYGRVRAVRGAVHQMRHHVRAAPELGIIHYPDNTERTRREVQVLYESRAERRQAALGRRIGAEHPDAGWAGPGRGVETHLRELVNGADRHVRFSYFCESFLRNEPAHALVVDGDIRRHRHLYSAQAVNKADSYPPGGHIAPSTNPAVADSGFKPSHSMTRLLKEHAGRRRHAKLRSSNGIRRPGTRRGRSELLPPRCNMHSTHGPYTLERFRHASQRDGREAAMARWSARASTHPRELRAGCSVDGEQLVNIGRLQRGHHARG